MDFVTLDAVAWLNISSSFVLGDKICRFRKDTSKTDRGDPNLFKDLVKYWMAFQIVQVLHEYGLKPGFNDELEEWSSDLYSIVQLRLIYLKRRVLHLAGTKNSSWTDRCRKSGRFEIKRFQVLTTVISMKRAVLSDC